MLTAIATPARSVGIEIEPAYVACARRAAEDLSLGAVTFVECDARHASLDEGTIFFLYTPFSGEMLREMIARLREQAAARPIRVATYGPCTRSIAAERWLVSEGPVSTGRIAIFRSRTE
jgi:hypothetical protein